MAVQLTRLGQRFWVLLLMITLAMAGLSTVVRAGTRKSATLPQPLTSAAAIRASAALPLGLGLHVKNLYGLNLSDQSFLADGWFWLQWGDEVEAIRKREQLEPQDLVEFENAIESGQYLDVVPDRSSATVSSDGTYLRVFKFSSKFYIHDVPQRRAPFDKLPIQIRFEVVPDTGGFADKSLVLYSLGDSQSLIGDSSDISGFDLGAVDVRAFTHVYPTDFGREGGDVYSGLVVTYEYSVEGWTAFFKWLLPLVIVMSIVMMAPSLEGALGDVRLAIPSGALLTLVFLHEGYKSQFPPVPYLTYLDGIYSYSYVVCLALFVLFLVGTNAHARASGEARELVARRVNRLDSIYQASAVIGFLVVAVVGWFV
jgi:hypothetical protein